MRARRRHRDAACARPRPGAPAHRGQAADGRPGARLSGRRCRRSRSGGTGCRSTARPRPPATLTVAPPRCFLPDRLAERRAAFGRRGPSLHAARRRRRRHRRLRHAGRLLRGRGRGTAPSFVGLNPDARAVRRNIASAPAPIIPSDRRFLDPIYIDVTAPDILGEAPEVAPALDGAPATARGPARPAARRLSATSGRSRRRSSRRPSRPSTSGAGAGPTMPTCRPSRLSSRRAAARCERFAAFEAITEASPGEPWMAWADALRHPDNAGGRGFRRGTSRRGCASSSICNGWPNGSSAAAAQPGATPGCRSASIATSRSARRPTAPKPGPSAAYFARGVSVGSPPDPFSADGPDLVPAAAQPDRRDRAARPSRTCSRPTCATPARCGSTMRWACRGCSGFRTARPGARRRLCGLRARRNLAELALESHRARCLVIGEDLGTVPEGFRDRLAAADILSYRVLFFERDGLGFLPPEPTRPKAVACVSTHDLPTLAGWWDGADIAERRGSARSDAEAAERGRTARRAPTRLRSRRARTCRASRRTDGLAAARRRRPPLRRPRRPPCWRWRRSTISWARPSAVNLPGTDRERPNWRRRLAPDVDGDLRRIPDGLPKRQAGPAGRVRTPVPGVREQRRGSVLGALDVGAVLGQDHDAGAGLDVRRHHGAARRSTAWRACRRRRRSGPSWPARSRRSRASRGPAAGSPPAAR